MTNKIDTTVKLLVEENRRKGFLTYQDMSKLMDDQFLPPDQMDQVFIALEDAGVEVTEDFDGDLADLRLKAQSNGLASSATTANRSALMSPGTERIDDPVRMYLTQMGEIPLLTRPRRFSSPSRSKSPASASARSAWARPWPWTTRSRPSCWCAMGSWLSIGR